MATFFGYEFDIKTLTRELFITSSSSCARKAGRLNVAAQVLGSSFNLIPGSNIPAKFSQILISGFTTIRPGSHAHERLLHILQALIAATEMGLEITLFFQNERCFELTSNLCKATCLMRLLYTGVLTTNQVVSEISKDPYKTDIQVQCHCRVPQATDSSNEVNENNEEQAEERQEDLPAINV